MLRAEVELAWKTQAGHRHQLEGLENEDAVFVTQQHPVLDALLMVADGMGGHPRPREASETAVRAARELLFDPARLQGELDLPSALAEALDAAHGAVRELRVPGRTKQPGTTLSIAALLDGQLYVAHVGDGSVYLMRDGQARAVAGGEDRRAGNRPAQFLGQEGELEPELRRLKVAGGDRLLLCTDGLTRYFNEAGPEALERVLGRHGVRVQAIASQLTAHSRPDEYDDDTTVAVAEVTGFSRANQPRPISKGSVPKSGAPEPETEGVASVRVPPPSSHRRGSVVLQLLVGAVCGAALLAAGFAGGYLVGRVQPGAPSSGTSATAEAKPEPASPEVLSHLPAGNVVLFDALGGRVFTLATRTGAPGSEPLDLQAFRVGADGRLAAAGRYRLDPARGELTDADGTRYPVTWDEARASLRVVRGGTLVVNTRPAGAVVWVDGRELGPAPQKLVTAAGRHRVRVEGKKWSNESDLEVPAGRSLTVTLGPQ
jgi:protein phosphatase